MGKGARFGVKHFRAVKERLRPTFNALVIIFSLRTFWRYEENDVKRWETSNRAKVRMRARTRSLLETAKKRPVDEREKHEFHPRSFSTKSQALASWVSVFASSPLRTASNTPCCNYRIETMFSRSILLHLSYFSSFLLPLTWPTSRDSFDRC